MPLAGGKYLVLNVGPGKRYLTLPDVDGNLTGTLHSGANNQKWIVDDLDNGTYHISSIGYDAEPYATSMFIVGSTIDAKDTPQAWDIIELDPGSYRIYTAIFAWTLGAKTITLQPFNKNDVRQMWKFQLID